MKIPIYRKFLRPALLGYGWYDIEVSTSKPFLWVLLRDIRIDIPRRRKQVKGEDRSSEYTISSMSVGETVLKASVRGSDNLSSCPHLSM